MDQPPATLKVCEMCEREVEKLVRYHAYMNETIEICTDCHADLLSTQVPKAEP